MDENNETESQSADAAGIDTPSAPSYEEQEDREPEADADTVAPEDTDVLDEDSEDEDEDDEDSEDEDDDDEDSEDEDDDDEDSEDEDEDDEDSEDEDEDDEDSEDEDEDDEDSEDEDEDDEEEYEPIDFWSVPEICAFGDDLECKFLVGLLSEIAEAATSTIVTIEDYTTQGHELVSPISEGADIIWIDPSNWRDPRDFMEQIGAESDTEQRIDREGWTEIVEIWKWEPWIGTHIDINADPEWEPWQRKAAEQARAYQIDLDARKFSRYDMDEVLKNLLRQTAVIQRELLRTTLAEELAELAEMEGASERDDEAIARYRDFVAQSRKAVEEASERCRELGTID